jgi:hypothetical protein
MVRTTHVLAASILFLVAALLAACGGGAVGDLPGADAAADGSGGGHDGGGTPGDAGGRPDGGDCCDDDDGGGPPDKGHIPDPYDPDNDKIDSDCDGVSDMEEFSAVYAIGAKTDPRNPDTDGDGLGDGIELGRTASPDPNCPPIAGDADPASMTDPTSADTDCDGVADGEEDANHDGKKDGDETDPADYDTDGDGLSDGLETGRTEAVPGTTCLGFVADSDPGTTTDPQNEDSDGDGIGDGKEDRNHTGKADVKDPADPHYSAGDETDPAKADTDGDGISDGEEDRNGNLIVDPGETDPLVANADADHDGMTDSDEIACGYDPNDPDMDKDGMPDGVEDKNADCALNLGETDPRRVDTDCDGITDGGEDADHDGQVDPGETNPFDPDTDGDGLSDGVETGVTASADAANCPDTPLDADPATKTDPTQPDSDGSGVQDGAEDTNKNGRVDPGELDPNDPNDDKGIVGEACATQNLTPIQFRDVADADVLLALAKNFEDKGGVTNLSLLTVGGDMHGFLFVDPTHEVGGFVLDKTPEGADAAAEEAACRGATPCAGKSGHFQQIACLDNAVTQSFPTWDGFPAVLATYDWREGAGDDLKGRLNLVAKEFLGAGVQGVFADGNEGAAGHAEPWRLQIEIVRRSNNRAVIVGALTTIGKISGAAADPLQPVLLKDVVNGSALAQLGDRTGVQCDVRKSGNPMVDFLWVVDDSCSMDPHQTAVARAADAFVAKLNNSQVDFRVALISTGYWQEKLKGSNTATKNFGKVFGFSRDLNEFKGWLKQPCPMSDASCVGSAQCTGTEKGVESAYDAMLNPKKGATPLLPTPAQGQPEDAKKLRFGAKLVIVFVSDAGDQSNGEAEYAPGSPTQASDAADGPWWDPNLPRWPAMFDEIGKRTDLDGIMAGAILCSGNNCGETKNPSLYDVLVAQTSGIQGLITDNNSVDATMQAIVDAAIGSTGLALSKPPISASLKVVQDNPPPNCPQPTQRHPVNGFDYDGVFNRVSFFGECRPTVPGSTIAISYRYWIDATKNPDGDKPKCDPPCVPPFDCNPVTGVCECPADCGGGSPGPLYVCDLASCTWKCPDACGGACGGYTDCVPESCECRCRTDVTCAPGHVLDPEVCECRCDAGALACDAHHDADLEQCRCLCKPQCGTCPEDTVCRPSLCVCEQKPG